MSKHTGKYQKYNIKIKNLHFLQISSPTPKFPLKYIFSSFGFLSAPLPFSYSAPAMLPILLVIFLSSFCAFYPLLPPAISAHLPSSYPTHLLSAIPL